MNNKMIKLLAVVGGLLLMSPLSFAGGFPNPGTGLLDGRPVIKRVSLSIGPSSPECVDSTTGELTGVGCVFADIMIVGRCKGIVIMAMLEGEPLEDLGMNINLHDITDIAEDTLEGRTLFGLGDDLLEKQPSLSGSRCTVIGSISGVGRNYEIRKVQKFVNNEGMISAVIQLVPRD